jgi:hypothetical protein
MRCFAWVSACSAWVLLAGCGGVIAGPSEDAGPEGVESDVADVDLFARDDSPFPSDFCADLQAKIDARRKELKVCCPFCSQPQCGNVVKDVCCGFSATATNVTDFEMMVDVFKQSCHPICPGACPPVPSNDCQATMNKMGTCQ